MAAAERLALNAVNAIDVRRRELSAEGTAVMLERLNAYRILPGVPRGGGIARIPKRKRADVLKIKVTGVAEGNNNFFPSNIASLNLQGLDLALFKRKLLQHKNNLGPHKRIRISRDSVLHDMFAAYSDDPNLIHHQMEVEFQHEDAVDLGGLTKEAFRLFWEAFLTKFCVGRLQMVPRLNHRLLDGIDWFLAGQILSHGLVLTGYWPWKLSMACIVQAITGSCSTELCRSSFQSYISEQDLYKMRQLCTGQFDAVSVEGRCALMQRLEDKTTITEANAKNVFKQLGRYHMFIEPCAAILLLAAGIRSYPVLYIGVGEAVLLSYKEALAATSEKVVASLQYHYTDVEVAPDARELEERVGGGGWGYLENFIENASLAELSEFLIFVTATDMAPEQIHVHFHGGLEEHERLPSARTCGSHLHLCRLYVSEEELADDLRCVIQQRLQFDMP